MVVQILHTLLGFSIVANIIIGLLVLNRKKNNQTAKMFASATFSASLWAFGILFLIKSPQYVFDQICTIGGALTIGFLGLFITSLNKLRPREKMFTWIFFFGYSVLFSILSLIPNLFVMPTKEVQNQLVIITADRGIMQIPFMFFGVFSFFLYILLLINAYNQSDLEQKNKILFISFACILASIIGLTSNMFLPTIGIPVFSGIGPISSLIFAIVVTYSIFKKKVFNIKILLAEIITFIFIAYSGAQVFLSEDISDLGFKLVSFLIILFLSFILLKSVNNEFQLRLSIENTYEKQSNFLADIAHRLKTPLTVAKTNIGIAKMNVSNNQSKELLTVASESIDKLSLMSSNLIVLGKIDFGISKIEKKEFNFSNIIKSTAEDFKVLIGDRKLIIDTEPNIKLLGDQARIQEMVLNLLDNSVKFTDYEKGIISITLKNKDNQIKLTIKDNGSGISKNHLSKLFDRYYQVEQRSGSAGIGLAIVKWIIDEHQGKINVKSELNEGTEIEVLMPAS